jgi:hypothetical protein
MSTTTMWINIIERSWLGLTIRQSTWLFAATEVVHLFGLTLLLGTTIVLNLRLFGAGLRQQSLGEIVAYTRPWNTAGLLLSLSSGVVLFIAEAAKMAASDAFLFKMALLFVALVYTWAVHRRVTANPHAAQLWAARASAALSLVLWFGVALAGRAIAFY